MGRIDEKLRYRECVKMRGRGMSANPSSGTCPAAPPVTEGLQKIVTPQLRVGRRDRYHYWD